MNLNLLFILLLIFSISCGKRKEAKKVGEVNEYEIDTVLEKQKITCAAIGSSHCPKGLARLFILSKSKPEKSSMCSGYLVSPNRLLTNHHCLSSQKQCNQTYISVYDGNQVVSTKCKRIIKAKADSRDLTKREVDFAVIEIEDFMKFSDLYSPPKKDLKINDKVTVWAIDHIDIFSARITQLDCKVGQESKGKSIELNNCPAIHGNSGSPAMNDRDELVGVLWGGTTPDWVNEKTPLQERRKILAQSIITNLEMFSNFL